VVEGGRRSSKELDSICHSTSDPTKLVNAAASVSYCPHRFGYLTNSSAELGDQV
jgi:hypothetical protein